MCVVCVTVAGTLVVASQITPIQVLSDFTSSQKTLTSFSGTSASLTNKQRSEIKTLVNANQDAEQVICTGFRLANSNKATSNLASNRAKAACAYAKRLNPLLETKVLSRVTKVKSSVGKVSVAVRTPVEEVVAAPNPVVIRTPFAEPFPEVFSRSELVKAALDSVANFVQMTSASKSFEIVLDKNASLRADDFRAYVDRIYAALPFSATYPKTIAVISNDAEFALKAIEDFGIKRKYGPCTNCAGVGWSVSFPELGHVIPHEIFHTWQMSAYGRTDDNNPDPNNPLNPPVWFQEGGATFVGDAFQHIFREIRYAGSSYQGRFWERLDKYNAWEFDRSGSYYIGKHATEYIVASVGFEKYLDIYRNVGKGQNFPEAFSNATGISLADFYDKFYRVQGNIRS